MEREKLMRFSEKVSYLLEHSYHPKPNTLAMQTHFT